MKPLKARDQLPQPINSTRSGELMALTLGEKDKEILGGTGFLSMPAMEFQMYSPFNDKNILEFSGKILAVILIKQVVAIKLEIRGLLLAAISNRTSSIGQLLGCLNGGANMSIKRFQKLFSMFQAGFHDFRDRAQPCLTAFVDTAVGGHVNRKSSYSLLTPVLHPIKLSKMNADPQWLHPHIVASGQLALTRVIQSLAIRLQNIDDFTSIQKDKIIGNQYPVSIQSFLDDPPFHKQLSHPRLTPSNSFHEQLLDEAKDIASGFFFEIGSDGCYAFFIKQPTTGRQALTRSELKVFTLIQFPSIIVMLIKERDDIVKLCESDTQQLGRFNIGEEFSHGRRAKSFTENKQEGCLS
jgi:hypothetical protein